MSDIESLRCTNCFARIPKDDVEKLDNGNVVECQYCGTSIRIKNDKQRPKIVIDIPPINVPSEQDKYSDWTPYTMPNEYYYHRRENPYTAPNDRVRWEYPTTSPNTEITWSVTY